MIKFKLDKKKVISIIFVFIGIILLSSISYAASTITVDDYNPDAKLTGGSFLTKAEKAFGWIQFIGTMVVVVGISFMGLKYMFGSLEEKAEYKKTMFPYLIGCLMILNIVVFISLIEGFVIPKTPTPTTPTTPKTTYCIDCNKKVQIKENGEWACGHFSPQ